MRKLFTLLFMCILAGSAMAAEIVFDPATNPGDFSGTQAKSYTVTQDGITFTVSNGMVAPYKDVYAYRTYKGQTITFNSTIGNITSIEFTGQVRNDTTWGAGGFVAEVGTYTANPGEFKGYWSGDNSQIVLKAEAYQVRAIKIVVTVGDAGLLPPTITPAGGTYYDPITVKMTCGSAGAKIYYTLNGSDPTTSSTQYTAPFELNQNTTVKAISSLDGETSRVVTAEYKFEERPQFGFGSMWDTADNTMVEFAYDAVVIKQGGNGNKYLYVYDQTGFGLIFGSLGNEYQIGDIIPAGFKGKKTTYKGEPELSDPLSNFLPAREDFIVPTPEEILATDVNHDHWAHYVVMRGAKISSDGKTITDRNGNTCEMYNATFNVPLPTDLNATHDIYAVVGVFNNYQILPLSFDEPPTRTVIPPTPVASIEELYSLSKNQKAIFTTPLTTIYQNGQNLYVIDTEGFYSLVYGSTAYTDFVNGDYINDAQCSWTTYGGNNQISPISSTFVKAGHGDPIEPQIMPIEEVSADMVHWFLGFENIWITQEGEDIFMHDATGQLKLFDRFGAMEGVNLAQVNYVEGFLTIFNNELELYPTVLKGGFGMKGDVNNDSEINIADINALIDLILTGNMPDEGTFWRADVAEDGELGIADVNGLIDLILAN